MGTRSLPSRNAPGKVTWVAKIGVSAWKNDPAKGAAAYFTDPYLTKKLGKGETIGQLLMKEEPPVQTPAAESRGN